METIQTVQLPSAELIEIDPPSLDRKIFLSRYLTYRRDYKNINNADRDMEVDGVTTRKLTLTVPGKKRDNGYMYKFEYKMVCPDAPANHIVYLPVDRVSEFGKVVIKLTEGGTLLEDPDVSFRSKQQSASVLDYRKRTLSDRLCFRSRRVFNQTADDPNALDSRYYDPYFTNSTNNGIAPQTIEGMAQSIPVSIPAGHVDLRGLTPNLGRVIPFSYYIRDALPNSYFSVDLLQSRRSDLEFEIELKKPSDVFFAKDIRGANRFTALDDMPAYRIQDFKVIFFVASSFDKDEDGILATIDEDSFAFYYPSVVYRTSSILGNGPTDLPARISGKDGVSLYKTYVSLLKTEATGGIPVPFNVQNFVNRDAVGTAPDITDQKYDYIRKQSLKSSVEWEARLSDGSWHEMIKNGCHYDNSLDTDLDIENYGTLIDMYDTEYHPRDPYNPMTARGRPLEGDALEPVYQPTILEDPDNPNSKFRFLNGIVIIRKGINIKGTLSLGTV